MFESDTRAASVIIDAIRTLFSWLDRVAYALLEFVYQLFFNVASADLFSNDTILKFYGRVQLILGVYMMFQLAMTILRGIVNPDSFTGGKDGGGGAKLISRIATALIMLAFLTPINIPSPQNEYEEQLKSNGILFGTLYSLQHRILANNTLGRLILGNDDSSTTYFDDNEQDDLSRSSRIFTSTILRGFYRINLLDESDRPEHEDGKDDAIFNDNRVCQDIDDDVLNTYTRLDANPGDIIGMINMTCEADDVHLGVFRSIVSVFSKKLAGKEKYMFTFMPLISTVTGLVFAIILLSFSIDIAVRAVKLAVLRLIAPIPLISYMDPKGSKDGAFNSWVKTLTSTYLDLFIRLAVIYFVIFLIQDMIVNGVVMSHGEGLVGKLSLIIIWIGLFVFAKQAPKFIKSVLGIKGEDGKLFSGFGSLAGVAGLGAAVGGSIGSGLASARASKLSDQTRASMGETDIFGRQIDPNSKLNKGKHLLSGIAGGFAGGFTGAKAAWNAKDHGLNASMEAMRKRNADVISRGNSGSTLLGRMQSTGRNMFMGEGNSDTLNRSIETNKSRIDALKAIQNRVKGEMVKSDYTSGKIGITGSDGRSARANYKDFMSRLEGARAQGLSSFEYMNLTTGAMESIDINVAEKQKGFLMKNNEDNYIKRMTGGYTPSAADIADGDNVSFYTVDSVGTSEKQDGRLTTLIHSASVLGGSSDFTRQSDGTIIKGDNKGITDRDSVWNAIEGFEDYNTQLNRQNAVNKADDRFSGGKK